MRKKGIIERLVIGSPSENDLTEADLPQNRWQQFRFIMRTRFGVIFRTNVLTMLFFLPLMVWDLVCGVYVSAYISSMSVEQQFENLINLTVLQYGVDAIFWTLGGVGLSGLYYVIRRICWGQSVKLFADFGKGVKDSWKQFALLGLFTGIVIGLSVYVIKFSVLTVDESNAFGWSFAAMAVALFDITFTSVFMFALCQSSLYNMSFTRLIVNSYVLSFKRFFRSLGVALATIGVIVVIYLIPSFILKVVAIFVVITIGLSISAVAHTCYCHGVFDDFINKKTYPDYVRVGLSGANIPEELQELPSEDEEEQQ